MLGVCEINLVALPSAWISMKLQPDVVLKIPKTKRKLFRSLSGPSKHWTYRVTLAAMSYYFAIIGTKDNPMFEHEFGTFRQGGDGISRFREDARHMNQFIVHASLDIVEEVQWAGGQMYLKTIDRYPPTGSTISAFITAANVKFLLLHQPNTTSGSSHPSSLTASRNAPASTTPAATEEAIKNFFNDVYDSWVKTIMSPFWRVDMPVRSPVFRSRVAASAKKYL